MSRVVTWALVAIGVAGALTCVYAVATAPERLEQQKRGDLVLFDVAEIDRQECGTTRVLRDRSVGR
jgi:hypothetical protein